MVRYYETFPSQSEASAYRTSQLDRYHPLGYGTFLTIHPGPEPDQWIVTGYRHTTCD